MLYLRRLFLPMTMYGVGSSPLKTNMRLATAAAAQACGGILSQDEEEQLQYADMLIDVSKKSELNSLSSHRSGG